MHAQPRRVVFIIDSDDDSRITHETILRSEGYEIITAADAARALSLLREEAVDLVLLGTRTGSMHALKLIQLLKRDPSTKQMKVVVMNGTHHDVTAEDLRKEGAHDVIVERIPPHELVRQVVTWIGRA